MGVRPPVPTMEGAPPRPAWLWQGTTPARSHTHSRTPFPPQPSKPSMAKGLPTVSSLQSESMDTS